MFRDEQAIENEGLTPPIQRDNSLLLTLENLHDIIEKAENAALSTSKIRPPHYVMIFTVCLLTGRALSCTYRYVTTTDALQFFFQEPFIEKNNQSWAHALTITGAALFCVTDAVLTIVTSRDSVAELCFLRETARKNLTLLRDNQGKLPIFRLVLLGLILPGSMLGAFFKGEVGFLAVSQSLTALMTNSTSKNMHLALTVIAYIVGGCSALCNFSFQGQQALKQMYIRHMLQQSDDWVEYNHARKWPVFWNQFMTFLISIAMTLVTMMATFYHKGNFDLDFETAAKALYICFCCMMLNTFYTSGPNFLYKKIQADYFSDREPANRVAHYGCCRIAMVAVQMIGIISSVGNSFSVFPGVEHVLLQISGKKTLSNESAGYIATGLIVWLLLAIPMFPRDYAYYAKYALKLLFEKPTALSAVAITQTTTPKQNSLANTWMRFMAHWKKPSDAHSVNAGEPAIQAA